MALDPVATAPGSDTLKQEWGRACLNARPRNATNQVIPESALRKRLAALRLVAQASSLRLF